MARPLLLGRRQAEDLVKLCAFKNVAAIEAVDQALRALPGAQVRASRLYRVAEAAVSDDHEMARRIVRQGLYLSSYARRHRRTAGELAQALVRAALTSTNQALRESAKTSKETLYALADLVENDNIYYASKAAELAFDHDSILTNAWVVTDVRPVLNRERTSAVGAVIFSALHIKYFEADGIREKSLVIEGEQLQLLAEACQEAITKSKAARQCVPGATDDSVMIFGEDTYELGTQEVDDS